MFVLEGNIGAGKSTLLKLLRQELPTASIALEPREKWQTSDSGQSLLERFYHDPSRWAYTMETLAMVCRMREHLQEQRSTHPMRIVERSIYSGHYCFAINDYRSGFMTDMEWSLYNQWFSFMTSLCVPPRGFIYLQTDPLVSLERVRKRNRSSESTVSLDYLQQIHDCHEQFLVKQHGIEAPLRSVPVLILNGNEDFVADATIRAEVISAIEQFVQNIQQQPSVSSPALHS